MEPHPSQNPGVVAMGFGAGATTVAETAGAAGGGAGVGEAAGG